MFDSSGSSEVSPWVRGDEVEVVWKKIKLQRVASEAKGKERGKKDKREKKRKREFRRVEKKKTKKEEERIKTEK